MALEGLFSSMKKEGYITSPLELYLMKKANQPNDRAIDVNAPSQIGRCMRANYFMRKKYDSDGTIDPRTQRVFDNGHGVHERLQNYLLDMHLLIMDEVPLINDECNIQGHTDGYIELVNKNDKYEVGILEIKSINDNQFGQLKDAKEEHKMQGLTYIYCAEERRKKLKELYKTKEEFLASQKEREEYFRSHYQHMKTGSHYTRDEKIENEVKLNLISDDVLYDTTEPISKVIFLYENKNTQELKEFVVERDIKTEPILCDIIESCKALDKYCKDNVVPPRDGTSKSCNTCRWCGYKIECWN